MLGRQVWHWTPQSCGSHVPCSTLHHAFNQDAASRHKDDADVVMRIPFHLKVGEIGHSIQWPLSPLWLSNHRCEIKLSVPLDVILYSLPSSHRSVHMLSHTKHRCVPSLSKCAILLNSLSSYAMLAHAR